MIRKAVWLVIISVGLISTTMEGQTRALMSDPLFAIHYDTQKGHFEMMPASLLKGCPELHNQYVEGWLYAHARTAGAEYFIVSGTVKSHDQENGQETGAVHPDITGAIVALRGSTCSVKAQDSFYWINDSPVWNLPEAALNEMAMDALHRYTKAFGGKRKFLKSVTHRERLAPVLRKQLDIFERQSDDA
jgi:hypothetical protein